MKEIIFLIDKGDGKFVYQLKNDYILPTLKNVASTENIIEKIYNQYQININNLNIFDETTNYVAIKANTRDCLDRSKYSYDVINAILPNITDEFQKEILSKLISKIYMETVNDSFWLGVILSIEDKISIYELKIVLTDFLLFFSSIFCEELIKYQIGGLLKEDDNVRKGIKHLRKSYLKRCPSLSSKNIHSILDSMGIDFNDCRFDIVLFLNNDSLFDINSRLWNMKKSESDLYNGIIMSPRRWIKNFLPDIDNAVEEIRKQFIENIVQKLDSLKFNRKPYSTSKLFKSFTINEEKIYILQRFGLFKTIMLISNILDNESNIIIKDTIIFDLDKFLTKTKAVIIELIWNDSKNPKLTFLKEIFANIPSEISNEFYKINRKCRDNIHYGFFNELNGEELELLHQTQDIYLTWFINQLENKISYKFGIEYKISILLANLKYWASKK